jgi:hypothetical protein
MMTNVTIFARQLYYLQWIIAACGFAILRKSDKAYSIPTVSDKSRVAEPARAPLEPDPPRPAMS